jgi:hypothetical protein
VEIENVQQVGTKVTFSFFNFWPSVDKNVAEKNETVLSK